MNAIWFEVYHEGEPWDGTKGYRWRLKDRNGRILADSGEAYSSRGGARRAVRSLIKDLQHSVQPEIRMLDDPSPSQDTSPSSKDETI
jgi:uncharacterized protein YegP (UPF0339 family)